MSKKPKVQVVTEGEEEPLPLEILQKEIVKLANVGRQIKKSGLKQRAIILLLQDMTKLPMNSIMYVLNSLDALEATYLKNPQSKKESK